MGSVVPVPWCNVPRKRTGWAASLQCGALGSLGEGQGDDFGFQRSLRDVQVRQRDGQPKPAWACAARIEIEYASPLVDRGLVGMPKHNGREAGCNWVDGELAQIVQHQDLVVGGGHD